MPAYCADLRALFPAPFGWHTRFMLAAYVRDTVLVVSVILIVAISIDLAQYLGNVIAADSSGSVISRTLFVSWYVLIRGTDRITEFLPLACFFGILWTETRHTWSADRLIFQISGRAPAQGLAPLLLFSLLTGSIELTLLLYLRPAAVMAQADARVGEYGQSFDRSLTTERKWIATGDNLILANIEFAPRPLLRDIRLFNFNDRHQLREIVDAASAVPIVGERAWLFRDGHRLFENGVESGQQFSEAVVPLDVDQLWLRYFAINAKYLPNDIFKAFASLSFQPNSDYLTWRQARIGIAIITAEMGLLAGCLSLLLLSSKIRIPSLLFVLGSGFAIHILSGMLLVLGEHGRISPIAAVWPIPLLALTMPIATYIWLRSPLGKTST